jgi:UDP-N-acetylmuramoyl-L-alanyl-D-glutamate--2,6-diaminopimelate ligase
MVRSLKNLYHLVVAFFSVLYFRYPAKKLKVIGVTGTDGKTTTIYLISHILKKAKKKNAFVSSVGAQIGDKEIDTGFHVTTPSSFPLQKLLRKIANQGYEYVVLEATSHGLDQHRLFGCHFSVGVVTNVTHEHLDYHQTYENYLRTKAKLFRGVKVAVLNRDDKSFKYLDTKIQRYKPCLPAGRDTKRVTYGIREKADFTPKNFKFKTSLPGEYNQYNCLAAIAVTSSLDIPEDIIRQAIASFEGLKGRMEEIDEGQDFKVYVDFAHTPNALEQVLKSLKKQLTKRRRLIAVFGSAGLRDRLKRPVMGEIAARLADITVLTAEDPRTENVDKIIDQIAQGCLKERGIEKKTFFRAPDRGEAIRFAIKKAKKGDIVAILGKGHEKSMCFGETEYPWSDQKEVRRALKKLKKDA